MTVDTSTGPVTTTMLSTTTTSTSESTGCLTARRWADDGGGSERGDPECGDGVLDPGESCDDGAKNGPGQPQNYDVREE
ncbi:MAG: hypothetical protein IPK80_25805 [Nannocystis sp.]|nr:hypothetical protein [Nannocystis sp.]